MSLGRDRGRGEVRHAEKELYVAIVREIPRHYQTYMGEVEPELMLKVVKPIAAIRRFRCNNNAVRLPQCGCCG